MNESSWKKLTAGIIGSGGIMSKLDGLDISDETRFWGSVAVLSVAIAVQGVSDFAKYWRSK